MRTLKILLIAIAVVATAAVVLLRISSDEPGTATGPADAGSTTSTPTGSPTTAAPVTTTPPATLPPGVDACDPYGPILDVATVGVEDLVEASGLAVSRIGADTLWSHNDSRDTARLYAFDTTGAALGSFGVPKAFAFDWEDIAAGPGPDGTGFYLYVGDIGDNFNIRDGKIAVYRVPDGDPRAMVDGFTESVTLAYRYPDGPHNAEAIFVDPVDPALYVITKDERETLVFRGTLEPVRREVDLELVARLYLDAEVSGADISWDGGVIALRGYRSVWMWRRTPGSSIADAFAGEPCTAPAPDERQGEAIAFDRDLSYWTVSEGLEPGLHLVPAAP